MKTPLFLSPSLAIAIADDIIIIILLAIIAAALISIAISLVKNWGVIRPPGGSGGTPPPPDPGQQALSDLQTLLQNIKNQPGPVTPEQCQQMRDLVTKARSGGVSDVVLDVLKQRIDQLCPG